MSEPSPELLAFIHGTLNTPPITVETVQAFLDAGGTQGGGVEGKS